MDQNMVILYVEDDQMSREVMRLLLQDMLGLDHVTIFEDSTNFIERVENLRHKPDMILLDIHVPPYSGFEMLRMLRSHPEYTTMPIVALTASVMNEEVQQLINAGFDGIVGKPVDMETFPAVLMRILNGEQVWFSLDDY